MLKDHSHLTFVSLWSSRSFARIKTTETDRGFLCSWMQINLKVLRNSAHILNSSTPHRVATYRYSSYATPHHQPAFYTAANHLALFARMASRSPKRLKCDATAVQAVDITSSDNSAPDISDSQTTAVTSEATAIERQKTYHRVASPMVQAVVQKEDEFGILEYVSRHAKSFTGILKHRFNDFLVNEVDLSGQIVRYKEGSVYKMTKPVPVEPEKQEDKDIAPVTSQIGIEKLTELLSEDIETVEAVKLLLSSCESSSPSITSKPISEKVVRTSIHDAVRTYFGVQLSTMTKDGCIEFQKLKQGSNAKRTPRATPRKDVFQEMGGNYCHFTLYKENIDTMQAIGKISRITRIPSKSFTFGGTKDKRAVTTQRISVLNAKPEVLLGANKMLGTSRIGDLAYLPTRLMLGSLLGNHFSIVLRNIQTESDDFIDQSMESFKKNGFINYYGMQRFGTRSISTHTVGIALLGSKWKEAVDLIMCPKVDDAADAVQARLFWVDKQDPVAAVGLFHPRYMAERSILFSFASSKSNTAYLSAIQASYVWNFMASERIRLYGLHPVVGDLVMPKSSMSTLDTDSSLAIGEGATNDPDVPRNTPDPIYIISKEDAANYTMADVVLPQPGHSIMYPKNIMAEKYVEFMAKDGFDPYSMTRDISEFSLSGAYRKVVSIATNVSWRILKYNDDDIPLVRTDMDLLEQVPEPQSIPDGKFTALAIEFTLGTSQYATMALREVTKSETSAGFHTQLSSGKRTLNLS
ncbi:hypothetical protein BASA61_009335 [Batrachochytrium salamandrivorans]|nr:hypothetical protein BASA61_009335 [Batrachochytrium salamandrivorans]